MGTVVNRIPDTKTLFSPITSLPLVEGTFLSRPNRFSAHCTIGGRETYVFMPNPGRMAELLLPGAVLILADHGRQDHRKTRFTVMAVRYQERIVFLHTHLNNAVARTLIESRTIHALKEYGIAGAEVTVDRNRFDFMLQDTDGPLILEVKSCTLSANGIAMFPDAVTERGRRHLQSLARMNGRGQKGALLFLIHHGSAKLFLPDYHTDYAFSRAFCCVEDKLPVLAISLEWTRDLRYRISNPQVTVPWDTIRGECVDRGHLLRVERDGEGYSVSLTGYAVELSQRARQCTGTVFPVRTSIDDSTRMAGVLSDLYGNPGVNADGWTFKCSHDPVPTSGFQEALLDFRMPRRLLENPG